MGFKCGIVGLPNVGKSTLFNALTASKIEAQNYPFCTIEPNIGMVTVPDKRLTQLADIATSQKVIPNIMEFVDIAGLVKGASKGEGLGNQFLGNIRSVDAIAHVVRCFDDGDITHVGGKVDPLDDIATIETELALADIQSLEKAQIKYQKMVKSGDKQAANESTLLKKIMDQLNEQLHLGSLLEDDEVKEICQRFQLLTAKPCFYIANCSEDEVGGNPHLDAVKQYAHQKGADVVAVCAAIEAEIATLPEDDRADFLAEMGMGASGLDQVIRTGYHLLGLITFFTIGPKEARAWTVRQGSTAPQAAGVIHTDFEKHFIRAEVIASNDYIACKGEQGAKAKGLWRLEGKDYIVKDGDVLMIRANC
ncbi:MAG: redox-regulated ATPase YchF [Pseudomonadota bacterium]|nr:redox-regulated ATPase YchF [Pseudomonadota bacterium]